MSFLHDCARCRTRCDGKSLGNYQFKNDVEYSEFFEQLLVRRIIESGLYARKTEKDGYPDVEVYDYQGGPLRCFIEVKAQRRSFMMVSQLLPESHLAPSETMALNLSDLLRYFEIAEREPVPVYILWVLRERPCIVDPGKSKAFYQETSALKIVYDFYGDRRRFRRKSGHGDVVNGKHLGVVVNYHFSLRELLPFSIRKI